MIKTLTELNLKVNNARLLTRQELMDFEDQLPDISMGCCWWLDDEDEEVFVSDEDGFITLSELDIDEFIDKFF